jgi:hypothetical protein
MINRRQEAGLAFNVRIEVIEKSLSFSTKLDISACEGECGYNLARKGH